MKFPALAALLRTARESKRLEQAAVARHVGLRQQAISTWERGESRPRLNQLPQLCALLNLDLEAVRAAGAYEATSAAAGQPRLRLLPFEQLSDDAFEAFVRDLYRGLHSTWEVSRNGSTGHTQYGVDVFATGDGQRVGIQCKHEKIFGPADVRKVINEVKPEARVTSGLIALSRTTATPKARLEVANDPGWALWDGEDLAAHVRDLTTDKQLALISAYFPRLREDFLGISAPSPWLSVDEYEPALAGRLGYDRRFELVGRTDELNLLTQLVADHQPTVLVVGRGGIGKTRLLIELARTDSGREVRFASRGAISPDMFELLPSGAPVIVLDDALSLDTNIESLMSGIRSSRPEATVVLSLRPKAEPELLVALSLATLDAVEIRVDVTELSIPEAEELARETLGETASDQTIELLARAGYDCPLILVIGSHLIRSGYLRPTSLAGKAGLRDEILLHFADVVTRGSNGDTRRAVLDAVATVQPARMDKIEFLDAVAGLSEQSEHVVLHMIDELEALGIVMRRGQSVRVVPDLLGEAVLERVLVSRSGIDTKWSMRVARLAQADALANAIRNISLIDWYRREASESHLGESLWESLVQLVLQLSNTDRKRMIHGVEAVAAVYPERAMGLAQQIVSNPAPDEDDVLSGLWGGAPFITAASTNSELSGLIRNASYDPDQLERGMELLLTIGRDDSRPENQHPKHALRVLRELGEYQKQRHFSLNEKYVETVGKWLGKEPMEFDRAKMLTLLKPALATEVNFTRSKGPTIEWSRHPINLEVAGQLRVRVVKLAGQQLHAEPSTALAAVSVLEEALRTAGRLEEMTPELEIVLGLIGDVLADPAIPPSVRLSAHRALTWQAEYGKGDRQRRARDTRRRLVIDTDYRVTRLLRAGWALEENDESDGGEDQARSRQHRSLESSQRVVDDVIHEWSGSLDDLEVLDRLHELMRNEQTATGSASRPDHLLVRLFEARPGVARLALADVVEGDDAVMATQRVAMMLLLAKEDPIAVGAAHTLADASEGGALLVASAIADIRGEAIHGQLEQIIRDLAAHNNVVLSTRLLSAARWWGPQNGRLILDLVRSAPISLDANLAETVAGLLVDGGVVGWANLMSIDRDALLERFTQTPTVEGYNFARMLNVQVRIGAPQALRFLMDRIEHSENRDPSYTAVPHSWGESLQFCDTTYYSNALRELTEWILDSESWKRASAGSALFKQLVGVLDAQAFTVLLDLIRSSDGVRIRLAVDLLLHAGRHFVLERPDFVEETIRIAQDVDDETKRMLIRGLHGPAIYGTRSRTIGVDDPDEVSLRDGAARIAQRHPASSPVRSFYEDVSEEAAQRLVQERVGDKSLWEPRRW